jgi:hypothetical protein
MRIFFGLLLVMVLASAANAQDSPFRKELKRADLTGTNMEVITSISEIKVSPRRCTSITVRSRTIF